MITVSATKARNNFQHYVNLAAYGNQEVIINKNGKPVAKIVGVSDKPDDGYQVEDKLKALKKSAGSAGSAEGVDMKHVYKAMKENYDLKSILGL